MSNLIFLDSVWKCLLTLTVSSSIVFVIALLGQTLIKKLVSHEKSKWFLNYHILFISCALIGGGIVLNHLDPELVAGCFNHFAASSNSYAITRILAGLYLAALSCILVFDGIGIFLAARRHKSFEQIENHSVNEELENLKMLLKIEKPIKVFLNEKAASPYVWGLFSHRLVVNPFLLSEDGEKHVKAILSHELMHIKGHDSAWLLLSHLIKRIFFFSPATYLFHAKHKMIVELAADERAVEQCHLEPQSLVKSIFEIAERCTKSQENLLQLNASREFVETKERIQSMMNKPRKRPSWIYPAFSVISLSFSLLVITVQTNASVSSQRQTSSEEMMCSQVRHEKVIENWLRIESSPNKCEMK